MKWTSLLLVFSTVFIVNAAKLKKRDDDLGDAGDEVGDDYSDFSSQSVKNGGAHYDLKAVTYSTIAPKLEIPTRAPQLLNASNKMNPKPSQMRVAGPRPVPQYNRGYYFQHYPWDRLPRRYLMRPGMTYVYPTQYQFAQYRYPYLDQKDPYNIYRSHPGIGGGCGGGGGGGCGGGYGSYGGGYQNYGGGCGGGGGGGCSEGGDSEEQDSSYEDEEGGKSGEAKINKKDPLEDLELEDLEKLSKTSEDTKVSDTDVETTDEEVVKQSKSKKIEKDDKDYDLIDDRKKFLVKWL